MIERRAATVAAESRLTSLVSGKAEERVKKSQADQLLAQIQAATSMDQLAGVGSLSDQFMTLRDMGRLTSDQEMMLSNAIDKAAETLTGTATGGAAAGAAAASADAAVSKAEIAGTFSSVNLAGQFGGGSIAERQLQALQNIDKNTKNNGGEGRVAA